MNLLRPFLKCFIASATLSLATASAETPQASVRFSNLDVLSGYPASISPERVLWDSPLLAQPSSFFTNRILDLSLSPTLPKSTHTHETIVTLTNGDTVRGQLAFVTDSIVSLDTWFAGRIDFNRLMVASVKITERTDFLYRGPTGLDDWEQSVDPPNWKYNRSAFRTTEAGSIARGGVLPDECSVTFETAWRGDSIRLRVILFSNDTSSDSPSSGYELSFQRGSIHLRNCKTQSFLGSTQSAFLMEADKARIEIRASTKSNKIALFINERIVEVWNDPEGAEVEQGRGLHFISGGNTPLRISKIGVANWDGELEETPAPRLGMNRLGRMQAGLEMDAPPEKKEPKDENRMVLANGDSLTGEVTAIENGIITVNSPLGEIKLPASRLRTVALKPVSLERCIRRNGDIRAWFDDGSSIVFCLESSDETSLTGTSQNFGKATFQIAAFNRIEFNIYSPDYEDIRLTDDW